LWARPNFMKKKRILVAPLNWGLGHATRCIPIIRALMVEGYLPIIASDGAALMLLQKEFPELSSIELPAYNISYTKNEKFLKLKLLKDSPKVLQAINREKKMMKDLVETHQIVGIISDNRLGVYSKVVPSVFITHQLNVLSGTTTWLSTKIHEKFIKKFDVCWVPDAEGDLNLSGKLGHTDHHEIETKYIGALSRFSIRNIKTTYDVMVLLSGPEPQRSLLEEKLLLEFNHFKGKVVFVKGVIAREQTIQIKGHITLFNFMTSGLLEKTINESAIIICRSGYTSIMDLAKLNKKAFFIPTPGQFEQEYLAKRLTDLGLVPSCSQDDFTIEKIKDIDDYKGLQSIDFKVDFKELFSLF
jgi:uncharacterized protein (TIGR00661 family)